jgi:hypothetical protein
MTETIFREIIITINWILVLASSCHWHQNIGILYIISQIFFIACADICINHGLEIKINKPTVGWLSMIIGFGLVPLISFGLL